MLNQVENIANIETSNETSKISCDLKEREQSMVQGWSTTDNLLESYEFGQVELKLAVATFMEEEPRFLDEEEQRKVLRLRIFYLEQNMKLRYLAFGGRDDDGAEGETGTTGIQITHFL